MYVCMMYEWWYDKKEKKKGEYESRRPYSIKIQQPILDESAIQKSQIKHKASKLVAN